MPLKDPEKRKEYERLRYQKNKEKAKENNRLYRETKKGQKVRRVSDWKRIGVICEDFDILHNTYINTNNCDWCSKDLSKKRNLEHNHYSGEVRGIVCRSCNGKIRYKDKKFQKVMSQLRDR